MLIGASRAARWPCCSRPGPAVIAGRDYVVPEDVKAVAVPVLAHRITVKPEMWMSQVSGRTVVDAVLASVAAPAPLETTPVTTVATGQPCAAALPGAALLWEHVTPDPNPWRPTFAYARAAASAVALIACALIWRRPDLLVIATPFAAITAWSVFTRPSATPIFEDGLEHPTVREGDATAWRGAIAGVAEMDLAVAALDDVPWVESHPPSGVVTTSAVGGTAVLGIGLRSTRWGTRPVEPVRVTASSAWASFGWSTVTARRPLTTLPLPALFDAHAVRPALERPHRIAPFGAVG